MEMEFKDKSRRRRVFVGLGLVLSARSRTIPPSTRPWSTQPCSWDG